MKVLVVDDDRASRHLIASVARSAGHEVMDASDGVEALELARSERPDVVLSDILMPRMDGYQLAREWKADPALAPVPVIFLTASYTDSADERFAMDLGAERFLTKPVQPDLLLEVLAEIAEGGDAIRGRTPRIGEDEILREYSDRLVRKLEHKVIELERANGLLAAAMETLSTELQVKSSLIVELGGMIDGGRPELDALRAHDELGKAAEGALALVVVVDTVGTVRFFSDGAAHITGYARDEVVGRDWFETLVPADERDARRAAMAVLLSGGGWTRSESGILTARGDRVEADWADVCWRGTSGDVAGVLAIGLPR